MARGKREDRKSPPPPTTTTTTTTAPSNPISDDVDNAHDDSLKSHHHDDQDHGHSHNNHQHSHNNNHGHSHGTSPKHSHLYGNDDSHDHGHSHGTPQPQHREQQIFASYQNEARQESSFAHKQYTQDGASSANMHSHVVCSHTQMAPECGHNECQPTVDPKREASLRVLKIVTALCFSFMCVELVGGYLSGSLAIMTDAAHLLSDLVSFMISLLSLTMASRSPNAMMTFGYHRAEILGALISILLIWALTVVLVYESIHRIINPDLIDVHGGMMLLVAIVGFCVNIVMGLVLLLSGEGHNHSHGGLPSAHGHSHGCDAGGDDHHDDHDEEHGHAHGGHHSDDDDDEDDDHHHEHDPLIKDYGHDHGHGKEKTAKKLGLLERLVEWVLPTTNKRGINVNAAILHVLGDLMQSVGVIIAALLIWFFPSLKLADPLCTLLFSVIVLTTTTRVMKQGIRVLMEGTPDGIDSAEVAQSLQDIPSVIAVHDLHIWSLSVDQPALAVHLVVTFDDLGNPDAQRGLDKSPEDVLNHVNNVLEKKYNISHTTIQLEEQYKTGVCVPKATLCKKPSMGSVDV